jgi:predicted RND superfamily exporter protein
MTCSHGSSNSHLHSLALVFGVGLDDTFIITGAYYRTDPDKEPAERIREAMQEIGLSISITTITTIFAFMLGCFSTIPAIFWLNLYAFPTIAIDFIFQITFFIGAFASYKQDLVVLN